MGLIARVMVFGGVALGLGCGRTSLWHEAPSPVGEPRIVDEERGGGPGVDVTPWPVLDLGRVASFPGRPAPDAVPLPTCRYAVTPVDLNFGVVTPPSLRTLGFQVRNLSTAPGDLCVISNLRLAPGGDATFSLPAGPIASRELQPGETLDVVVRAWAQGQLGPSPSTVQGQVVFNVSDPTRPQATVNLSAQLAFSCLTIAPSELDFGTVQVGCGAPDRTFQIYNTCTQPITVQRVEMLIPAGEPAGGPTCPGSSPCPEFRTVSTGGISPGTVINHGAVTPVTFSLDYRPMNEGPDTGAYLIRVLQYGVPMDYVVTLRGKGDLRGLNTDTFRQQGRPSADILLVIDDSCSMTDNQAALATNLAAFLRYATANQVDFRIAVTITELSDPTRGVFKQSPGGHRILTPATPNLASEYAALVNVGMRGSNESCMDPAVRALTAPFITDPAKNAGFLRPDAVLAVVCVTDATDQALQTPQYYLSQLANIKGAQRPSAFTYNVVGPFNPQPVSPCAYDGLSDDGRHDYLVRQTNGVKEEICTPDWATTLENIGRSAFGYRKNFYLTARPDLSAGHVIEVKVDGVTLPQTDARGARVWAYDALSNSIDFDTLYVPEAGSLLTVTYVVACL